MDTLTYTLFSEESWLIYLILPLDFILWGLGLQWLIFPYLKLRNNRKPIVFIEQLLFRFKTPAKYLLPILLIYGYLGFMVLSTFWYRIIETLITVNFLWVPIALLQAVEIVVKHTFEIVGNFKTKDRKILTHILKDSPLWDKKVVDLPVANISDGLLQYRARFSASYTPEIKKLSCGIYGLYPERSF